MLVKDKYESASILNSKFQKEMGSSSSSALITDSTICSSSSSSLNVPPHPRTVCFASLKSQHRINEDRYKYYQAQERSYFALWDGHGTWIADECQKSFLEELHLYIHGKTFRSIHELETTLVEFGEAWDEYLYKLAEKRAVEEKKSMDLETGCTGIFCFIYFWSGHPYLICGQMGHPSALIAISSHSDLRKNEYEHIYLLPRDRPNNPIEQKRIVLSASLSKQQGILLSEDRLMITRGFGYFKSKQDEKKQYKVTTILPTFHIHVQKLSCLPWNFIHILLGTDGFWDAYYPMNEKTLRKEMILVNQNDRQTWIDQKVAGIRPVPMDDASALWITF